MYQAWVVLEVTTFGQVEETAAGGKIIAQLLQYQGIVALTVRADCTSVRGDQIEPKLDALRHIAVLHKPLMQSSWSLVGENLLVSGIALAAH